MPLEPAFVEDCPYGPGGLLIDEILSIDAEKGEVICQMPMHDELPLTREQRVHPVRHPRHLSGGLMVHMTGMLGFVHAYYVLGLRHAEGWIGYGAKIHEARFLALAKPGMPIVLKGWTTRSRRMNDAIMVRYQFEFRQGETVIYTGDQTAMWAKVKDGEELPGEL
ncbi:MAG: hotdog fold domain-containing protein [Myxococcales bacterium]|nr:hotdog fold domain-containing protein [Myxococcales bacterium]